MKKQFKVAPNLKLRVRSSTDMRVGLSDGPMMRCGPWLLRILDAFSSPLSLQDGLDRLKPCFESPGEWIKLTSRLSQLRKAGIIVKSDESMPSDSGFGSPPVHIRILNDRLRTESYQSAIHEQIRPGDVVIDIGTGTGILAATAAKAGAKKVYAIEQSAIADTAEQVFRANGLAEKITLIRGHSMEIDLPEKANVLLSEIIGNDPLGEAILPVTADALERHLTPHASLIPGSLDLFAQPLSVPSSAMGKSVFTESLVTDWQQWYGLNFSSLSNSHKHPKTTLNLNSYQTKEWPQLTEPIHLASINFHNPPRGSLEKTVTAVPIESGFISGILLYFETQLSPSIRLSIAPHQATAQNSWASLLWLPPKPLKVDQGSSIQLSWRFSNGRSEFEIK